MIVVSKPARGAVATTASEVLDEPACTRQLATSVAPFQLTATDSAEPLFFANSLTLANHYSILTGLSGLFSLLTDHNQQVLRITDSVHDKFDGLVAGRRRRNCDDELVYTDRSRKNAGGDDARGHAANTDVCR